MSEKVESLPSLPLPPKASPPKRKTVYINFYDGINESKAKTLMGIISEIYGKQKPDELYFLFSSPGGSVSAGTVLYNFLRSLPLEVVMHNTGSVDSIGTVIFLAGHRRFASPHSSFHFHGVQLTFQANAQFSHVQLTERLSILKQDEFKIAGIIAERSSLTVPEIKELFHQGESKDATFAKEKSIVEEIKDPIIPKDALFITVNLN